jgi:hypothetical protein
MEDPLLHTPNSDNVPFEKHILLDKQMEFSQGPIPDQ